MAKPPVRQEPFLIRIIGGIFVGVPLGLARSVLTSVSKINRPGIEKLILGVLLSVSLLCILSLSRLFDLLNLFLQSDSVHPGWESGIKLITFYLVYQVITLPVFLAIAYLDQESKLFKGEKDKRNPDQNRMWWDRLKSDYHKVYLGEGFETKKPLYLTNDQRLLHTITVGSTGSGKTESVMLPMIGHDIAHGKGMIIIDGKGDLELLDKIHYIAKHHNRLGDLYFFSLNHTDKSNTFNPFHRGNPTELKDLLVNSIPWGGSSEDFFRRMAEQAALTVFNAMAAVGHVPTFRRLHSYLTDLQALTQLSKEVEDQVLKEDIGKMVSGFKENRKFLAGLMSDLFISSRSEFSDLLDTEDPEIDLLELYKKNQICYFSLDLQKYSDTSRRFGRMIIQGIRAVSSYIQAYMPSSKRHFFGLHIDDAADFLDTNFASLLSKGRASGLGISIYLQSLGDLRFKNAPGFQQQVIENTNAKIILRQDDPFSIETFTKIAGTRRTTISTYQTQEQMLGKGLTGAGSVREGQTFRVEPDLIRGLKRGEAVMIWKSPSLMTAHIKLDFIGHPSYPGIFRPNRKKSAKRPVKKPLAKLKPPEIKKEEKPVPPPPPAPSPQEIENPLERIEGVEGSSKAA